MTMVIKGEIKLCGTPEDIGFTLAESLIFPILIQVSESMSPQQLRACWLALIGYLAGGCASDLGGKAAQEILNEILTAAIKAGDVGAVSPTVLH